MSGRDVLRKTKRPSKSGGRDRGDLARQLIPALVALIVVAALAVAVLPDRDPDPTFPVQVISTTVIEPDEKAEAGETATQTPTPDLTAAVLTPAMITFDLPGSTPTPREIRRPEIDPTATPTPEFLSTQYLSNGGAENDLQGWYVEPGVSVTTDVVHGGNAAILVETGGGFASSQITIEPGRSYRLSAWGVLSSGGESGQVGIGYFDANGQRLTLSEPTPLVFDDPFFARQVLTFTPVPEAVRVEIYLWKPAGTATFVVDDISVRAYSGDPQTQTE